MGQMCKASNARRQPVITFLPLDTLQSSLLTSIRDKGPLSFSYFNQEKRSQASCSPPLLFFRPPFLNKKYSCITLN